MKKNRSIHLRLWGVWLSACLITVGIASMDAPITKAAVAPLAQTTQQSPWNPQIIGHPLKFTYETVGGVSETLYVFEPIHKVYSQAPTVVYIHGGSLVGGNAIIGYDLKQYNPHDAIMSSIEAGLVSRGFVFVTINYRLAPTYKWPAQIEDAKTAIRYLRENASQLHIDPQRIGVMGDSAGGGLSNFLGLTGSNAGYDVGQWLNESSSVSAVVDMFGPTNRRPFSQRWLRTEGHVPNPVFGVYTPSTVQRDSAINYATPGAPPFLIIQGKKDTVEPPSQSIDLYRRLQSLSDSAQLILVRNSQHEFHAVGGPIWPTIPMLAKDVIHFFERTLTTGQPI